jgi:hypothetical protein
LLLGVGLPRVSEPINIAHELSQEVGSLHKFSGRAMKIVRIPRSLNGTPRQNKRESFFTMHPKSVEHPGQ